MHHLITGALLIISLIVINARSTPPSKSLVHYHSPPAQYRDFPRRQDEMSADFDVDDDDDGVDESRESVCEEAMDMIVRHRNIAKLNPAILLYYCPHYGERLALARAKNNTSNENNQQEAKRKRYDDSINDDDDNKRRALRRRELKKRVALRFIRKRMS